MSYRTPQERFIAKINFSGPTPHHHPELGPCWLWTGGTTAKGYGRLWVNGRLVPAHRFSFEAAGGCVPEGMVCHRRSDRVPRCVHPHHVRPTTTRENSLRGETLQAKHLAVTHCPSGHPYEGANLRVRPNGDRECRACGRAYWDRAGKARRAARMAAR